MALTEEDKKEVRALAQEEAVNVAFSIAEFADGVDNFGDFRRGLRAVVEGTVGLDLSEAEIDKLAAEQSPKDADSTKAATKK